MISEEELSRCGAFCRQETTCLRHFVLNKSMLKAFCMEKIHVRGALQGKDDVWTASCKEK